MKKTFWIVSLLCHAALFAQIHAFTHRVTEVSGDLNRDRFPDKVVITQDTLADTAPYRLEIFFGKPDGTSKLAVTANKIIPPQYPDGRNAYDTGIGFSGVTIKNGVLSVNMELLRGHYEHKFRFQNGHFELIGFSEVSSDGHGVLESVDYNLSTGARIEKEERYGEDRVLRYKKTKVSVKPLPRLQDIVPMENGLY